MLSALLAPLPEREVRFALACPRNPHFANSLPVFVYHREEPNIGLLIDSIVRHSIICGQTCRLADLQSHPLQPAQPLCLLSAWDLVPELLAIFTLAPLHARLRDSLHRIVWLGWKRRHRSERCPPSRLASPTSLTETIEHLRIPRPLLSFAILDFTPPTRTLASVSLLV